MVSWARARREAHREDQLNVVDTDGKDWRASCHPAWGASGFTELLGRVGDLKAAYEQLPISLDSRKFCVISVVDPSAWRAKLSVPASLMFGQTAAVYAFLRFSRAFAHLMTKLFSITVVEFFDDFTQLEPRETAQSAH